MFLDNINRKLQVVLTSVKTTLDMPVLVSYTDIGNASSQPGLSTVFTNGTTTADILIAASSTVIDRKVNEIQIYNRDTAAKGVQVYLNDNGTQYQLVDVTLAVDDVLGYTESSGWYVMDVSGNRKTTSTINGIISTSPTTGVGYGTGAGGAVTQITTRTTGVTINKVCGSIQTDVTSLAAEAAAVFIVTNSSVAIGDVVVCSQRSGSNGGNTIVEVVAIAAGSFSLMVSNNNPAAGTAETGAIIINFAIIKSVQA
jgi:hypothetical protein